MSCRQGRLEVKCPTSLLKENPRLDILNNFGNLTLGLLYGGRNPSHEAPVVEQELLEFALQGGLKEKEGLVGLADAPAVFNLIPGQHSA